MHQGLPLEEEWCVYAYPLQSLAHTPAGTRQLSKPTCCLLCTARKTAIFWGSRCLHPQPVWKQSISCFYAVSNPMSIWQNHHSWSLGLRRVCGSTGPNTQWGCAYPALMLYQSKPHTSCAEVSLGLKPPVYFTMSTTNNTEWCSLWVLKVFNYILMYLVNE